MIFRVIKNRDNPYFQMNRCSVEDARLSYKAVGIHAYLMSKPDKWEANETDITNRHTDGRDSVRSGIQELIRLGYMARVQIRDKAGKIIGWCLEVYETPDLNPFHQPESAFPDLDKPDVGEPDLEKPRHSNNSIVVINEVSNSPGAADQQLALLGFTSPKEWFGRRREQSDARARVRVADDIDLDAKTHTALTDTLIDIHRQRSLVEDAGNDNALRSMQDKAIALYRMGYKTVEAIQSLHELWLDTTGYEYPMGDQLVKFASAQKDAQKNGVKTNGSNHTRSRNGSRPAPDTSKFEHYTELARQHNPYLDEVDLSDMLPGDSDG